MSDLHGTFGWYELMTTDTAAAEAFYKDVIGWSARDSGQTDKAYTLFLAGAAPAAGLMALPDGGMPVWIGYILVDDVDAYAARLTQAGGVAHRPPGDIPGVGRFAMVADPQGAAFVLFRGLPGLAPAGARSPGQVGWRELLAVDGDAAFAFYAGLFGWTATQRFDMGPMGPYQLFAAGDGGDIGGVMTKPASVPAPFWSYYFEVDSVAAAIQRLRAGGGTVINGPHQVPGDAWIVQATDPQGAMFSLTSRQA